MVDEKIVKWARDASIKGFSKEQIKNNLLQRGFGQSDADNLISTISQPSGALKSPAATHHYGVWWAGLIVILVVASILTLVFTGNLNADFGKKEAVQISAAQKIAAFSKPGTILVKTIVTGTVSMPVIASDEEGYPSFDEDKQFIPTTEIYTKYLEEVLVGSGFIISPDGYIITNAHVVSSDENSAKDILFDSFAGFMGKEWAIGYGDSVYELITPLANYIVSNGQLSDIKTTVYVSTGVAIPGVGTVQKENPADIRKVGTPNSGRDVAILKIDGKNLPTMKLGNSDEAKTGNIIYVLGYPGASELDLTATGEPLEPTLTSGVISAERKTTDGFRLLQTDTTISPGNSGGPAFNEKGEVVGIATLATVDPITEQQIQGYNYLVPINFAKDFLQELNIQNKQGSVDEHYRKGIEYLWNKKYKKAIEELEAVKRLYPAHPYVQNYLTETQEALEK